MRFSRPKYFWLIVHFMRNKILAATSAWRLNELGCFRFITCVNLVLSFLRHPSATLFLWIYRNYLKLVWYTFSRQGIILLVVSGVGVFSLKEKWKLLQLMYLYPSINVLHNYLMKVLLYLTDFKKWIRFSNRLYFFMHVTSEVDHLWLKIFDCLKKK